MRLLNKRSHEFQWFVDNLRPPYAILSHRWQGKETSLQEFEQQRRLSSAGWSRGTAKVLKACSVALNYHAGYVWVDTCCIDKSSSAELQEAINSMYRWYEQAEFCFVYLDDVRPGAGSHIAEELSKSKWFMRGWTLQELLAPKKLYFFDAGWNYIGDRESWKDVLTSRTNIASRYFGNTESILSASIAERMSWMSTRTTTRIEDLAYCMLGIFGVNMTMLYGEGEKAFLRLQYEIIQHVEDETIFAWTAPPDLLQRSTGLLALHPVCFMGASTLDLKHDVYFTRDPYRMTNRGLEIETYASKFAKFMNHMTLVLNCTAHGHRLTVELERKGDGRWIRRNCDRLEPVKNSLLAPPSEVEMARAEHAKDVTGDASMYQTLSHGHKSLARFKVYIR